MKRLLLLIWAIQCAILSYPQDQQGGSIENYDFILDQPQGEMRVYQRSGLVKYLDEDTNSIKTLSQQGTMTVVFADDGIVYIQNPVSELTGFLSRGCWVKGTLSSDGHTITVPLGQNIDYIRSFDIVYEMHLYRYDSTDKTFVCDLEATAITYTIDDEGVITLNGTSEDCILSAILFSPNGHEIGSQVNGLWCMTGDYESVYTPSDEQLVSPPAGITGEEFKFLATANDGLDWLDFRSSSQLVIDGDDVYLQGFCRYLPKAWVKGRREGSTLTFAPGQYIGSYKNEPLYFMGARSNVAGGFDIAPVTFTFDGKGTYTSTDFILINGKKDALYIYLYYYGAVITQHDDELVAAPEELQTCAYTINYQTHDADNTMVKESSFVNIGFQNDSVYMQHFWSYLPDAWVKGKVEGNQIVFEGKQFLGFIENDNEQLPAYFIPFDTHTGDLLDRVAFDYDAATGTLQAPGQAIGICLNRARLLTLADVYYPVMTLIPDVAVTPAQPAIIEYVGTDDGLSYITLEVSDCGANGETLDPNKLSYQLLADIEGVVKSVTLTTELYERIPEEMTAIPWLYEDNYDVYMFGNDVRRVFLNAPVADYNRIGVQSIYTGGGETRHSDIAWRQIKEYVGIAETPNTHVPSPAPSLVDLQGRQLTALKGKGIYISNGRKVVR